MVFSKSQAALVAFYLLASSQQAFGRVRWLERDDRPVRLDPRRFGQEHPAVIDKLSQACPGQVCGTLSGAAITPLLAAQPECSQQDMADQIIGTFSGASFLHPHCLTRACACADAAQQFDDATKQNMIALAVEYRQVEKNTPPDFTTNPPANRNSVFCQKAPKNAQLNGLVQAQDPANDPNLFFDPATKATVKKGSQANTSPFGGANTGSGNNEAAATTTAAASTTAAATTTAASAASSSAAADDCQVIDSGTKSLFTCSDRIHLVHRHRHCNCDRRSRCHQHSGRCNSQRGHWHW